MKLRARGLESGGDGYLEGQLLVAMPRMSDRRFRRSVIYLCAHSEEGAMGLIINQHVDHIDFPDLLERLGLTSSRQGDDEDAEGDGPDAGEIMLPADLQAMPVHNGGPVETGRGFVLHTKDYFVPDSSLAIRDGICLTATLDILRAIAAGRGPKRAILALGYAGWAPGQLESEIHANGWLHCPADPELIFNVPLEAKYDRALRRLGIDPGMLSGDAGHA